VPFLSGSKTLVYRGIREKDEKPVVIKMMRNEYPTLNEIAQFRNQYNITKNLNLPGIIKTYSLENYYNSYALIMEDFGGISLDWELKGYVPRQNCQDSSSLLGTNIDVTLKTENTSLDLKRFFHRSASPNVTNNF
jgi:serine/threonine protein kinase